MTKWEELELEPLVIDILQRATWTDQNGHVWHCYLTGYDLAIEVDRRDPSIRRRLRYPFGGKGTSSRNMRRRRGSLVQYLALRLSVKIDKRHITQIEKAFLYPNNLCEMHYRRGRTIVESSNAKANIAHAMFRYIG